MPTLAPSPARRRRAPAPGGAKSPVWDSWRPDSWLPPAEEWIDEWAERVIVLPRAVSARPGPLDLSITPYLREILRAFQDPQVEEVTWMTGSQVSKTMACIALILYHADVDPWPCLHVMPREEDAQSVNVDRYQPVIRESPRLARHLTGAAHDATRDAIRINGATINFAGANSPAGLASRAICILILDETDKYPAFAGREADPIDLARERTKTFTFRKIFKTSTPTTEYGYIWNEWLSGDQRKYHVPCPHCGRYQELVMIQIKWPPEHARSEDVAKARSAYYECVGCGGRITDGQKLAMLRKGVWCPAVQTVRADGTLEGDPPPRARLSYHLASWYAPWVSWTKAAVEFLRTRASPAKIMNFKNSWEGWICEDTIEELKPDVLRSRVGPYKLLEVPHEAKMLTAGVDVQLNHFYYVIRAWGAYGESWLVRCGQVMRWEDLKRVLFDVRYTKPGQAYHHPLELIFIDAGFRGDEVYRFCRATGCQAVRGDSEPRDVIRLTPLRHGDGSQSYVAMLDTRYFKDKLHRIVRIRDGDPGAWHLAADTPDVYFEHMIAEQRVRATDKRTGRTTFKWKIMKAGASNHLFDCEIYALAAAESRDVEHRYGAPTMTGVSPPGPPPKAAEGSQTDATPAAPQPQSIIPPRKRPFVVRRGLKSRFFGG